MVCITLDSPDGVRIGVTGRHGRRERLFLFPHGLSHMWVNEEAVWEDSGPKCAFHVWGFDKAGNQIYAKYLGEEDFVLVG